MNSASKVPVTVVLGLRVANGIGLVAAPAPLARRWLGWIFAPLIATPCDAYKRDV
jgi:hypothetical protein